MSPRRRRGLTWALAALLLAAAAIAPVLATGALHDTVLVTRADGMTGAAADGDALAGVSVSGSGRYVAFTSAADNLSSDDDDTVTNVYVRDTEQGTTQLVSRADGGAGAAASGDSSQPAVSPAGRYVAFVSTGDNLSPADDDSVSNVYLRDIWNGRTYLVSRGAGGVPANGDSHDPSVSGQGQVAFESVADNLTTRDDDSVQNVYVSDPFAQTTVLVSRQDGAAGAGGNGDSFDPSISSTGLKVAFASSADNLLTIDDDSVTNIYVHDVRFGGFLFHVSRSTASGFLSDPANADSSAPALSRDGRHVAFVSLAENMTADADPTPAVPDVFVRDVQANLTTLVSRATGATGARADGPSSSPSIAADGRVVAFVSESDNLVADDGFGADVYLRSGVPRQGGTLVYDGTQLVSRASGVYGTAADAVSSEAELSQDTTAVAFLTGATNLSADDGGGFADVFVRELRFGAPAPPPPDLGSNDHGHGGGGHGGDGHGAEGHADGHGDAHGMDGHGAHAAGAHFRFRMGSAGVDRIFGSDDHDKACGGAGNDLIMVRGGPDVAYGDLCGGAEPPATASASHSPRSAPVRAAHDEGTAKQPDKQGSGPAELIPFAPPAGVAGNDNLVGGRGNDQLYGGWGNDRVVGGSGNDKLYGGVGRDRLAGGPGTNTYSGGPGKDFVNAANGKRETVDCGAGRDVARADRRDRVRHCEDVRRISKRAGENLPDLLPECPGGGHDCHEQLLPECPGGGHKCHEGGGVVVLTRVVPAGPAARPLR